MFYFRGALGCLPEAQIVYAYYTISKPSINAIDLNPGAQFIDRSCDALVVAPQLFRRPLIGGDLT